MPLLLLLLLLLLLPALLPSTNKGLSLTVKAVFPAAAAPAP
jgi:hypothetical protein